MDQDQIDALQEDSFGSGIRNYPTMTGNTGKADNTSIWGSGLLNLFGAGLQTAGNVYTTLGQTNAQQKAAAAQAKANAKANAAGQSSTAKFLIFGVVGIVVLAVIVLVLKRR